MLAERMSTPSAQQRSPALQIGNLLPDHTQVRSKHDLRQQSWPRDPVHAEHAGLRLVHVAREHVPDRWLRQEPMRFDATDGLFAFAIRVVEAEPDALRKSLLKEPEQSLGNEAGTIS